MHILKRRSTIRSTNKSPEKGKRLTNDVRTLSQCEEDVLGETPKESDGDAEQEFKQQSPLQNHPQALDIVGSKCLRAQCVHGSCQPKRGSKPCHLAELQDNNNKKKKFGKSENGV